MQQQRGVVKSMIGLLMICVFSFIFFTASLGVSADDHEQRSVDFSERASVVVKTAPTPDATTTALSKQKLEAEIKQLQRQADRSFFWAWFWGSGATLLSTLVAIGAGFVGFCQWRSDRYAEENKRKDERDNERTKQDNERSVALARRAEERFQSVVEGLGSKNIERQVGAAIMLRTFLQQDYKQFYQQTFDLAVAHLRLREAHHVPLRSTLQQRLLGAFKRQFEQNHPQNTVSSIPLDSLSQALIQVFGEAFHLARDWAKDQLESENKEFDPHTLDASSVRLDNAYLSRADFARAWLEQAFLPKAYLFGADLSEAGLSGAHLSGAHLSGAHLNNADLNNADLNNADLSGAYLEWADLRSAHLKEADLSSAHLNRAYLEWADLHSADLEWADLHSAHLSWASLCKADLSRADLHSADLEWADLEWADLRGANLTNTHPECALSLSKTKMSGVIGLDDPNQRQACIDKGAIFDDEESP